jgi:hypothetical protein
MNPDREASMDDDDGDESLALLDGDLPEGCRLMTSGGKLGPVDLDWIGSELRAYYDDILREPIPHRLLALVDQGLARRVLH